MSDHIRRRGDVPEVDVHLETIKYLNAVIIKIEILGADADARESVATAIKTVVESLKGEAS